MKKYVNAAWCLVFAVLQETSVFAQDVAQNLAQDEAFSFKGYVKSLNTVILPNGSDTWLFDNLLHNRLSAKWYASRNLTVNVEARTRLFYGESVQSNPLFSIKQPHRLITSCLAGAL